MYDRTIDRMSDGASEFLVQFYLSSPKLSITVLLAVWLILFFFALWYFVLLPAEGGSKHQPQVPDKTVCLGAV